jgi:UDP-N-acetylglucosamine 2-epimerase (non-hydrolysing)
VRIVSIVGARPQFVKLAAVGAQIHDSGIEHLIIHTGQHYDQAMSESFFTELRIPAPDVNLGIGSGTHSQQTGAMLMALEPVLLEMSPDWTLVYGDTNSTLAGALVAAKAGLPVAHLEAGLRSFNRSMPEEINRVVVDHASDLLLAPTETAHTNLADEGLEDRAVMTGDVMADVCLSTAAQVKSTPPHAISLPSGDFVLATLHRPYNTDEPDRLQAIIKALAHIPVPVLLPVHPRLASRAADQGLQLRVGSVHPVAPLSYPELIFAAMSARAVVTDSGGLQKEAYLLGVPCTTVRSETEWVETLVDDWNVLCSDDLDHLPTITLRTRPGTQRPPVYGAGHAAEAVVAALLRR